MSTPVQRRAYIQTLLADYLELPHTPTRARPPDRRLAAHFYDRAIPLATVQDAFLVATSRRLFRTQRFLDFLPFAPFTTSSPLSKSCFSIRSPTVTLSISNANYAPITSPRRGTPWKNPLIEVRHPACVQKSSDPRDR